MFGYADEKPDFIVEHSSIILAMLVPWTMKKDKCLHLVVEICEIIQKDMATTLSSAFLPIYLHLNLYENEEIQKKGMEFLLQNAENSLYDLLKSDVTVSFIFYFVFPIDVFALILFYVFYKCFPFPIPCLVNSS